MEIFLLKKLNLSFLIKKEAQVAFREFYKKSECKMSINISG